MQRRTRIALSAATVVIVVGGVGAAVVGATTGDDEHEKPITGSALQRASDAALDFTGGGRVSGTEVGDEESYYEVEVTLTDGSQVDVQLDQDFHVVASKADHENGGDADTD